MTKSKLNFWLDLAIGGLFLLTVVSIPGQHGQGGSARGAAHSVSGVLMLAGCALHLALHWGWIEKVVLNPAGNLPLAVCRKRRLALWQAGSFLACGLTGFAGASTHWAVLHSLAGAASIGLIGAHLLLHRRWIVSMARRDWNSSDASSLESTPPT